MSIRDLRRRLDAIRLRRPDLDLEHMPLDRMTSEEMRMELGRYYTLATGLAVEKVGLPGEPGLPAAVRRWAENLG